MIMKTDDREERKKNGPTFLLAVKWLVLSVIFANRVDKNPSQ